MANFIKHYGTPRRSGRYPWGSGEDPEQRNQSFIGMVKDFESKGLSEKEIANNLGISIAKLRIRKSIEKDAKRLSDRNQAQRLKDKGYSNIAIGKRMNLNESSVRALLDPIVEERANITKETANILKNAIDNKKYIDVGAGVERHLGISRTKMDTAVGLLEEQGYKVHYISIPQVGTGKKTSIKVLTKDDVTSSDVFKNRYEVKMPIDFYSEDGGRNWKPAIQSPISIDSKRIKIKYKEDGGADRDGIIELRRGVEDISLGNVKYAQVRIGVDGTHFMKGVAVYSDDLPNGVDIVYNSKKPSGTDKYKVFKSMQEDPYMPNNPFGSTIRQKTYKDSNGKEHLSPLNIVNEEGDWNTWSRNISSQILSKQLPALAKKQLDLALNIKKEEYDEIMSLTNPTVKAKLLQSFSDDCDAASVHLKAAALPRQANKLLLPFTSIKDNEVYAPDFKDGENVVLIRHPHGGIFEIPELKVNNKNPEAKKAIKNAVDAIGINPKVAAKLSGADFDGDTVLVIPNNNGHIKTAPSLKGLKDFDHLSLYKSTSGPMLTERRKELLMGDISNLITDMTIRGATDDEKARAIKHSMVVIDAVKHELNYKQSAIDNNISELKLKYQGKARAGASTLISRASSELRVPLRKDQYAIDPKTGKKVYKYVTGEVVNVNGKKVRLTVDSLDKALEYPGETYTKILRNGKTVTIRRTTKTTKMAEIDDARKLSSGSVIEGVYADYANSLKSLANKARKSAIETKHIEYSPSANKVYKNEVESLLAQLNLAIRHKPLERQAQLLANKNIKLARNAHPDLDPASLKKLRGQSLNDARMRTGGSKNKIRITSKEWAAIQAGAISHDRLSQILLNTDSKIIKQYALPRTFVGMSPAKVARASSMLNSGYTRGEIADLLGVSVSTLDKSLSSKGG